MKILMCSEVGEVGGVACVRHMSASSFFVCVLCCAGAVDKRGRPMRKDAGVDELRKLYRTGEEEKRPEDINVEETARKTAKRDINITAKLAHLNAVARGEVQIGSSSSSEDSSDSEDEDIDLAVSDKVLALPQAAREPAARTTQEGEETCRLAVVNMDWEHVRAVDVFAALQVRAIMCV